MKKFKVALQLYSVRDAMELNTDDTLAKVKAMGYDYVEPAGYSGHTAQEFRALLDKHGLECVSVHQAYEPILENPDKMIADLKLLGTQFCAVPWMGVEKHAGSSAFTQTVEDFKKVGTLLQEAGIQLLYHNHDFEFQRCNGEFLLDLLYQAVPAQLLKTEVDTCWVRYAGYDPAAYLRKYAGRSPVVHLKDFACKNFNMGPVYALIDEEGNASKPASQEDSGFEFRPLGMGVQDFPAILSAADDAGADIVVVEQDASNDRPSLEAVKISREYLKTLGL